MKSAAFKLLVVLSIFLVKNSQGSVSEPDFFKFGTENGDLQIPPNDDGFVGPFPISTFLYFGKYYSNITVNIDGALTFDNGILPSPTPVCRAGALPQRLPMIAPFWADVDCRQGGKITYRQTTQSWILGKANLDVQAAFPNLPGFDGVSWAFIATWYQVRFSGSDLCDRTKENTFQATIATDGTYSFAIFYYNQITWTTGTKSRVQCSGLGGTPAKAGIDVGDGVSFIGIPGSCTMNILNIPFTSNINSPGKWVFRIDGTSQPASCDTSTYLTTGPNPQPLIISPSIIPVFGNLPITLKGPCLEGITAVVCQFYDPPRSNTQFAQFPTTVGEIDLANGVLRCEVPFIYSYGQLKVGVNVTRNSAIESFFGFLFPVEPDYTQVSFSLEGLIAENRSPSVDVNITLNWYTTYFDSSITSLDILQVAFNPNNKSYVLDHVVASGITNIGYYTGPVSGNNGLSITNYAVTYQIRPSNISKVPMKYRRSRFTRLWIAFENRLASDGSFNCSHLLGKDGPPIGFIPCPPHKTEAQVDFRFEMDDIIFTRSQMASLYPGAEFVYRQRTASSQLSGNQCVYNSDGKFVESHNNIGGSRSTYWNPNYVLVNPGHNCQFDILPWFYCCKFSRSCKTFFKQRPSTSEGYIRPDIATGQGDPHWVTLGGTAYNFNGAGEYYLVYSSQFILQARLEPHVRKDGRETNATVIRAIAIFDSASATKVQVQLNTLTGDGLRIYINSSLLTRDYTGTEELKNSTIKFSNFSVSFTSVKVILTFTGFAIELSPFHTFISLVTYVDPSNKGKINGLLGRYDDNPENYLTSRNGTVISSNSSYFSIYSSFGMSWRVPEKESVFDYKNGKSYNSYSRFSYIPSFNQPNPNDFPTAVRNVCGNVEACYYDYSVTGDLGLAQGTKNALEEFYNITAILNQKVIVRSSIWIVVPGIITLFLLVLLFLFFLFKNYNMIGRYTLNYFA